LQHRAYSISSSGKQHPDSVHLTVASVRYDAHGRQHKGVCSTFLADLVGEATDVRIFFTPNNNFRVPNDDNLPMVMVGPGTGIAPFRAFLQEREFRKAPGKNWLFFGDRNASTDFIYREEIEAMQASGLLTKLDLAFSRDQAEKIYVQDRMLENGAELFAWLEQGGYFFVCGDAYRMAKDVDQALLDVIRIHGNMSATEAAEYVNQLKKDKRYVRDVY
jgi:sulfite reductase (NADPH) flavoprotein alpha-component